MLSYIRVHHKQTSYCYNFSSTNNSISKLLNQNMNNEIKKPTEEGPTSDMSIEESIKITANNEGLNNYTVAKGTISTGGGSYLATLYTVDITGHTLDGAKEVNLFIKNKIPSDTFLPIDVAYARETFAYTKFAKNIEALQDKAEIPKEYQYKMAKFYDTNNPDLIIMDNMTKKGYEILPTIKEKKSMTLEYAETAMKKLAMLHGLFHALNEEKPDFCEELKTFKHPYVFNDVWRGFAIHAVESILGDLETTDAAVRVKNFIPILLDKYPKYIREKTSISTLCHGDYRINNILTKIENGKITDQLPVDYQIIHYGNPINDINFFIFSCTDRKFRTKHMQYLKEFYYKSLQDFLEQFNIDIEDVCPRNDFEELYKETLDCGLMVCLQFLSILCPLEDDHLELNLELDITKVRIVKHDFFIERLNEVVQEFIEWGYL